MKILIVHNYYQRPGGEDDVVKNESELLQRHGHEVKIFAATNDKIQNAVDRLRVAWMATYSHEAHRQVAREIAAFAPDVVHVHNYFPVLSPSVYDACRDAGVPVVQTLHNYRLICIGAQLTRNAKPCELCIHGQHHWGVIHKCYRNSALASAAGVRMIVTHNRRGTWNDKVQRYITPSHFMKGKFVEAGFPSEKVFVKPNFVPETHGLADIDDQPERDGALFAARFSQEKGIDTLLRAWRGLDVPLHAIGNGPLVDQMQAAASDVITVQDWVPLPELIAAMQRSEFLVMPSTWYEGFPVTLTLCFASGLPVIASRLGAMAEVVEDGRTGLHFTTDDADDLAAKVRWAREHPDEMREMGRNAWRIYKEKYSSERNYELLIQVYEEAIGARAPVREARRPLEVVA